MIDTVCLLVPKNKIEINQSLNTEVAVSNSITSLKSIRNPTLYLKKSGYYFPRLTSYSSRFGMGENVKIEFSVPKLIFQNNLDEVYEDQFSRVLNILQKRLQKMGVKVKRSVLRDAHVSSVHYSKNILVPGGCTASHIISEINKVGLKKTFDLSRVRYSNDGQSLYIHAAGYQFVIYDKIADLKKSHRRAIDKDQTYYQKSLFPELNGSLTEVLRLEVRLNLRRKVVETLKKVTGQDKCTFFTIFSSEISKSVVNKFWDDFVSSNNMAVMSVELKPKEVLLLLTNIELNIKPNRLLYFVGLYDLVRDGGGVRELRSIVERRSCDRSWYRISRDLRLLDKVIPKNYMREWAREMEWALKEYKTFSASTILTKKEARNRVFTDKKQ